jgi:hypothetical protein
MPEIMWGAIFSKGRGLRVRRVRPHECRGLSFPIHALTMVRWPRGDMPRSNRSLPYGRAEPAPPRGAIRARMALRGKAREDAEGGFLGGTHSVRPRGEAVLKPRDNMITEGQTNGRWPNGRIFRWKQGVARGRAEPAPPRPRSATGRTGGPKRGSAPVRRDADIAGVRSPPLRGPGRPREEPGVQKGEAPGKAGCRHRGRAEPAPPRNRDPTRRTRGSKGETPG